MLEYSSHQGCIPTSLSAQTVLRVAVMEPLPIYLLLVFDLPTCLIVLTYYDMVYVWSRLLLINKWTMPEDCMSEVFG